jgi:hypothetical protein
MQQGFATGYAIGGFIMTAIIFPAIQGLLIGDIIKRFFTWLREGT